MAKKVENVEVVENVEIVEPDKVEKETKKSKVQKDNKKSNKNNKDKKERKGLFKRIKESFSELKKVSWPTFGKTVKQTGVVLVVVTICTLLLFGVDRLFSWVFRLFT